MEIFLFSLYSKKINSTAKPSTANNNGKFDVRLKAGTSILNPVFELSRRPPNTAEGWSPLPFTYAIVPAFQNRCYFINDWIYKPDCWEIHCSIDALGSHRERILSTTQFVSRARVGVEEASNVLDTMPLMLTTTLEEERLSNETFYSSEWKSGFFVLGVISAQSEFGCVDYYKFDHPAQLSIVIDELFSDATYKNVTDVSDELMKNLSNPMQYVTSCTFYPLPDVDLTCTLVSSVRVGFWDIAVNAEKLKTFTYNKTLNIEVPKHHQSEVVGSFANLSPYSSYCLHFPPFGVMPIDATRLADVETLQCETRIDLTTGEGRIIVLGDAMTFFGEHHAQVGIEVPIAARVARIEGLVGSVVATGIGHLASLFSRGGEIANSITGVCNAIAGSASDVSTKGNQKSRAFLTSRPKLYATFKDIDLSYIALNGRAVCRTMLLSDLSGFAQVLRPKIDANNMSRTEKEEICRYMEGGFYIE